MQETVFFRIMSENEGGELGSYVKAFFLGIIDLIVDYLFWILGVPFLRGC